MVIAFLHKVLTSNSITLDGYDPLHEDDYETYLIGEEIARNCQAYGPGLFGSEAGKSSQLMVQIFDRSGQEVKLGGMPVTATIQNEECLYFLRVHDNDDGTYGIAYTIARQGKYQLNITINEEHHIFKSPFEIDILSSKTINYSRLLS